MNKELRDYYERQFDMMSREGWQDFMETVDAQIKQLETILSIKDEADLRQRQGKLDVLYWIKSWKTLCEEAYRDNEEDV